MWMRGKAKPPVILTEQDRIGDLEILGLKGPTRSFIVKFLLLSSRNLRFPGWSPGFFSSSFFKHLTPSLVTSWYIYKILCILLEHISTSRCQLNTLEGPKDRVKRTEKNTEGQIEKVRRHKHREKQRQKHSDRETERLTSRDSQRAKETELYGFSINPCLMP